MSTNALRAGQLVRISNHCNPAYGRIGMITGSDGTERKFVSYADLPPDINAVSSEFTCSFLNQDLAPVTGVECPIARHYLLIEVVELIAEFTYYQPCLAHVSAPFSCDEVAHAVVQHWYEGNYDWDVEEEAYIYRYEGNYDWDVEEQTYTFTEFNKRVVVQCQHYNLISLGEYVRAQKYLKDRTPHNMTNRSQ